MGNEQASRILQATSQSLANIGTSLITYQKNKEDLQAQQALVKLNKIDRLFQMRTKASPAAQKVLDGKIADLVNDSFGTAFDAETFKAVGSDLYKYSKYFLDTPTDSEEEKHYEGAIVDLVGASQEDPKAPTTWMTNLKAKKGIRNKFFPPTADAETEIGAASLGKELGLRPSISPTGGGSEGRLSMVAPPLSETGHAEIMKERMKHYTTVIDEQRGAGTLTDESAKQAWTDATSLYPDEGGKVSGAGGTSPTAEEDTSWVPTVEGGFPKPKPQPQATGPTKGKVYSRTPGKLTDQQKTGMSSLLSTGEALIPFYRDVAVLMKTKPLVFDSILVGGMTEAFLNADSGTLKGLTTKGLAMGARSAKGQSAMPGALENSVFATAGNLGVMIRKMLEGATGRGMTDMDQNYGKMYTTAFGIGKAGAIGRMYAGTMYALNGTRAMIATMQDQNVPEAQYANLIKLEKEMSTAVMGLQEAAIGVEKSGKDAKIEMPQDIVSDLARRLYPKFRADVVAGRYDKGEQMDNMIRNNPNQSVILLTMGQVKDSKGGQPLVDQLMAEMQKVAEEEQ